MNTLLEPLSSSTGQWQIHALNWIVARQCCRRYMSETD